jgi:hypothetical protein
MENSLCVPRSCPLTNIVTIRANSCELLTVASSSCQERSRPTWPRNAHESAAPLPQSRHLWSQSPDVGERYLCSHLGAEHIGNCAIVADIGPSDRGWRHAVASAGENSPIGVHRCRRRLPAGAKLDVLLFPASISVRAYVADLDFVSWRESETTRAPRGLVAACLSLSVGSRAERFSANFCDRLATVRTAPRTPLRGPRTPSSRRY